MTVPINCPACKVNMRDKPIPKKDRHWFGGRKWFMRVISVQINDRHHHWRCPDCGHEW